MFRCLLPLLALFSFLSTSSAQINKYTITVAPFVHDSTGKKFDQFNMDCRNAVLRTLLSSGRFILVDRDVTKELETERKLQKSESFIDGKVVEQGKAIGAEYILTGYLTARSGKLEIVINSVADNQKIDGGVCTMKDFYLYVPGSGPPHYIQKKINQLMSEIIGRWLAKDRYTVVREIEGDEKSVEKLLLAAGSARGLKKGQRLEVFYTAKEMVDSMEIERDVIIGEMKVDYIENANFSILKEKEGKKEIKAALNERKKLYCRIKE